MRAHGDLGCKGQAGKCLCGDTVPMEKRRRRVYGHVT